MFTSTLSQFSLAQAAACSAPFVFRGPGRFGAAAAARRRATALGFSSRVSSAPALRTPFGSVRSFGSVVLLWVA